MSNFTQLPPFRGEKKGDPLKVKNMLKSPSKTMADCGSSFTISEVLPGAERLETLTFGRPHVAQVLAVAAPVVQGDGEDVTRVPRQGMGEHIAEGPLLHPQP